MSVRCMSRVVSVVSLGLCTVVGSGLMAVPAGAAAGTTTLHFYSVDQTFTRTDAAGQPTNQASVGGHYDDTNLYYVGNHKHHASSYSASSHSACTITSASTQECSTQIAIGGSLLLENDVTATVTTPTTGSAPINGGTGKYKNARGTDSGTNIGNNSDITITLTG